MTDAARGGLTGALLWGHGFLALVQQARGEPDSALATLADAAGYVDQDTYGTDSLRTVEALVLLAQGNLDAAARWASTAEPPLPSHVATISVGRRDVEYVAFLRVWLAQAAADRTGPHLARAHELIQRMLEPAEATGRTGRVIELLAHRAVSHELGGDRSPALDDLARALVMAEPAGYRRTFLELGAPMARLLEALLHAHRRGSFVIAPAVSYLRELLERLGLPAASSKDVSLLPESLSARELDVLRLMAAGAPNPRIAEELVVGVATVKTHVNGIFRKLGATTRIEAIVRARELRLV